MVISYPCVGQLHYIFSYIHSILTQLKLSNRLNNCPILKFSDVNATIVINYGIKKTL